MHGWQTRNKEKWTEGNKKTFKIGVACSGIMLVPSFMKIIQFIETFPAEQTFGRTDMQIWWYHEPLSV
jgi:hypothetical protein